MSDLHLKLKGQQDVSLLVTALQREKDLIDVQLQKSHEKLVVFEQKFSQSSERFYEKYSQGEMGDTEDIMTWAGEYQFSVRFKQKQKRLEELILECQRVMVT